VMSDDQSAPAQAEDARFRRLEFFDEVREFLDLLERRIRSAARHGCCYGVRDAAKGYLRNVETMRTRLIALEMDWCHK
jgi:hypothetical protein